jgi:hypothetical protein
VPAGSQLSGTQSTTPPPSSRSDDDYQYFGVIFDATASASLCKWRIDGAASASVELYPGERRSFLVRSQVLGELTVTASDKSCAWSRTPPVTTAEAARASLASLGLAGSASLGPIKSCIDVTLSGHRPPDREVGCHHTSEQ